MVITVRHFETEKNTKEIHGEYLNDTITDVGYIQAENISNYIKKRNDIISISYFPTTQCIKSAKLLSKLTGLPIDSKPISLKPFNMGIASGLSNQELKKKHPYTYKSLEQFRKRIIDCTKLNIINSETCSELEIRLLKWWKNDCKKEISNKIVIGSNSTLIMLTNLFLNKLPSSKQYKNFHIPNGAFREWNMDFKYDNTYSYPDIIQNRLVTENGYIQTSCYYPNWIESKTICIIVPGYFGNSRLGPYSIYVRIARNLNKIGIKTILMDFLGSGESSDIERSYNSDIFSIQKVIEYYKKSNVLLIGHSLSVSLISEISANNSDIFSFGIAPVFSYSDLITLFFTRNEVDLLNTNEKINRRGITITKKYIRSIENKWKKYHLNLSHIFIAKKDQYSSYKTKVDNVDIIHSADHNFSVNNSYDILIERIIENINKYNI